MSMERLEELLEESYDLENNATKVAVLEEASQLAESLGAEEMLFEIRSELIEAATYSGYQEKALVAFSWCLGVADKDPELFDEYEYDLLWKYKWVLGHSTSFPQISRKQIHAMEDDLERRLQERGYSLRPAHYYRFLNALDLGDPDRAAEGFQKWLTTSRDWLADCEACELNKHVTYHRYRGEHEECLIAAAPLLNESMGCAEIPHHTFGSVLRPLLILGRDKEAKKYHRRGYQMTRNDREFLDIMADHLEYLIAIGDRDKAVTMFQKHFPWFVDSTDMDAHFDYYSRSMFLFQSVANESDEPRKLKIPKEFGCYREDDTYVPSELANWFEQEAKSIAGKFNARNGNDYYSQKLEATGEFLKDRL